MTTQVQICNMALQAIGTRSTITDIADTTMNEAIQCKLLWDQTRDELLSRAWWSFARKTAVLPVSKIGPGAVDFVGTVPTAWSAIYPAPPWNYEYLVPGDVIAFRYIAPGTTYSGFNIPLFSSQTFYAAPMVNGAPIKFITANSVNDADEILYVLLTNQQNAVAVYTARIEDPIYWSPDFIAAFINLLAAYLAQPLTGERSLRTDQMKLAEAKILMAQTDDANEGLTIQTQHIPDWLQIRGVSNIQDDAIAPYGSVS